MRKGTRFLQSRENSQLGFSLGCRPVRKPGSKWGVSSRKGEDTQMSFFAITTTSTTTIKGRPSPSSPPRPRRMWGMGARVPKRRALLSGDRHAPEPAPLITFFFSFSFFCFSLFSLFSFNSLSVHFFSLCRPGPPLQHAPSVGEDQVGDAGLEPVPRDHLADLGCAVVRELEVRTRARLQGEVQVSVQRRRRAETAQGHALKV